MATTDVAPAADAELDEIEDEPRRRRLRGTLRDDRRFGLRARIVMAFVLGALLLSGLFVTVAYTLTRNNLLDSRESTSLRIVGRNASAVLQALNVAERTPEEIVANLSTPTGSLPILQIGSEWVPLDPLNFAEADVNSELLSVVIGGEPAQMRYRVGSTPYLVIGIPLIEDDAAYFEAVPLRDIDDTLRSLGLALAGGAAISVFAGAGLGWWAARRVLLPLDDIGEAAVAISAGELDTRLEAEADRDLGRLTASFNLMAGTLQQRIERDARFASEVSHELRSPLMTLTASLEVLHNQRDEMPARAQTALDLLETDLDRFQQLVEDLLEISRFDVGSVALQPSNFEITEFVRQALAVTGSSPEIVHADGVEGLLIHADKRRLARVIANLVDNANKYADGVTSVEIERVGTGIRISLTDEGPGVPEDEQLAIFDRFSRGVAGGSRGAGTGVGLGLALVAEHIRLHGGTVSVEPVNDDGTGSRFVIDMPGVLV
ncbi:MAG: HAMP domain-containing histidine kinase [Acidimicrobiia bacterium]|nr:HAMP domain-containing histidine kinase [Acidimicrobiia bacterium]